MKIRSGIALAGVARKHSREMRHAFIQCMVVAALMPGCGVVWAAADVRLDIGGEYSSGKYGSTQTTDIRYFPVTGSYATGPWLLKLTVPYLQISGPGNIVGANINIVRLPLAQHTASTTRRTVSGLGDVISAASYAWYENRTAGLLLDLTGKVKFGTADPDQNLGTGKNDYSIQADVSKRAGRWALFSGLGWKDMGNPSGITFKNPWYGSVGASYAVPGSVVLGMVYDQRGKILDSGDNVRELAAFVSVSLGPASRLQGFLSKGYTSASPERAGGFTWSLSF